MLDQMRCETLVLCAPFLLCSMKIFWSFIVPEIALADVTLSYLDEGEGAPILLIHGFGSNKAINWVFPGWVEFLKKAGRRVIAVDNRGHGASQKFYDPADYGADRMAEDAALLLDALGITQVDVMGYSMGARITTFLTLQRPDLVRSIILGGMGWGLITGIGSPEPISQALEADRLSDVTDPIGRMFRIFAEQTKSDRLALAACMRSSRQKIAAEEVKKITVPVLIGVGTKDVIAGSPRDLAALMLNAEVFDIEGKDHMTAVGDKSFKERALAFLSAL